MRRMLDQVRREPRGYREERRGAEKGSIDGLNLSGLM